MAELKNVIFCMRAENLGPNGVNIINLMSAITPEYVPGLLSFSVVVAILGIEREEGHTFSTVFCDPDGLSVASIEEQKLPAIEDSSNLPDEHKGIHICINFSNVNFKKEGIYSLNVYYDGDSIGRHDIYVKGRNE